MNPCLLITELGVGAHCELLLEGISCLYSRYSIYGDLGCILLCGEDGKIQGIIS